MKQLCSSRSWTLLSRLGNRVTMLARIAYHQRFLGCLSGRISQRFQTQFDRCAGFSFLSDRQDKNTGNNQGHYRSCWCLSTCCEHTYVGSLPQNREWLPNSTCQAQWFLVGQRSDGTNWSNLSIQLKLLSIMACSCLEETAECFAFSVAQTPIFILRWYHTYSKQLSCKVASVSGCSTQSRYKHLKLNSQLCVWYGEWYVDVGCGSRGHLGLHWDFVFLISPLVVPSQGSCICSLHSDSHCAIRDEAAWLLFLGPKSSNSSAISIIRLLGPAPV